MSRDAKKDVLQMKERFLRCAAVQFPNGVPPDQHRDIIRTFAMGWNEALRSRRDLLAQKEFMLHYGAMINQVDWYPDSTWKWWKD